MNRKINCLFFVSILLISSFLVIPSINADVKKINSYQNENNIIEMISKINKSMSY